MEFKDKIKMLREKQNLTLEEVAQLVGVSAPTIQRYESGEIKNVRRDKIANLAKALGTTPTYLMDWDNPEPATKEELDNIRVSAILQRDKIASDIVDEVSSEFSDALKITNYHKL